MTTATMSPPGAPLMLDWLLPEYDATIVEHEVIEGEPEAIYRAITTVDMAEIRPTPAPEGALRLGDMPEHGDWVKLADDPPDEFAFGVVGRVWGGETVWETIDADHFVAFDRPGFAKIGCSISLRPYGTAHTLVSYEARTQALDPESRAHFLRYWRVVRPGVAIVMRAFLHAVAKEVSDANPDP